MEYFAHHEQTTDRWQTLEDHLEGTALLAQRFATPLGTPDMGYRVGRLHDVGKRTPAFQKRLHGGKEKVDHSTAGALLAGRVQDLASVFCVAGHHGGLPNLGDYRSDGVQSGNLAGRMKRKPGVDIEDSPDKYFENIPIPPADTPIALQGKDYGAAFFYVRMLFACLVDADWQDTEAFMTGKQLAPDAEVTEELMLRLQRYIEPWLFPNNALNQKRCGILRAMLESTELRGLFSLTVPTGGGKTVSSMAFALRHALSNGLRRIIYIIPYTSIIEQTQTVFEEIFGKENVVAHYANVDFGDDENDDSPRRRAAENWNAPIILTTAVQFFESLFANRSSRCRKLHNIAQSVLIFDEAQMLPVHLLYPCVWAISQLVKDYGCSAVLCTATQPSLGWLFEELAKMKPRELCHDHVELYDFFRRVSFKQLGKLSDEALAERLQALPGVLCIVNNRRQAQVIFSHLPSEGSFHLSTTMTAQHRRKTLDEIRRRLKADQPCRVVSTSLIEAGVDVDFPIVFRAMAGLDAIIQAAGRCNREGKRSAEESIVYVFETESKAPSGMIQNIAAAQLVMQSFDDIASPEAIEAYFNALYFLKGKQELDKKGLMPIMTGGAIFPYADVAERFKLIESETCTLYVPYGEGCEAVENLSEGVSDAALLRALGSYAVSVYAQHFRELLTTGAAKSVAENAAVLVNMAHYSGQTGLAFHVVESICEIH